MKYGWKNVTALVCILSWYTPSAFSEDTSEKTAVETVSNTELSEVAESSTTQATSSNTASDRWRVLIALYGWLPNVSGDLTVGPIDTDFNLPITKSIKQLKGAFFTRFEVSKSRVGIATDVSYIDIGKGGALNIPLPDGGTLDVDLDEKLTFWELWPFYRVVEGKNAVDIFGGIRYYGIDTTATINQLNKSADRKFSWVDPMFGARWIGELTPKISVLGRGDVAGFGAGSTFTFNIQGNVRWQFHPHIGLAVGYRWMDIDYEAGELGQPEFIKVNTSLYGPLLGLTLAW